MAEEHPNISLLKRFNPASLAGSGDQFAEDVIWHFSADDYPTSRVTMWV
ncbi:MAG: hypothetical protein ACU84Q_10650 [Gammaproteobacteria bacterium]